MIIKNRKLVPREGMDVSAFNVAEIERMLAELPDDVWYVEANEEKEVMWMFNWHETPQEDSFWGAIQNSFTVAPVTNDDEIAELEATIAQAETRLAELRK
jgi:hypothetical protein